MFGLTVMVRVATPRLKAYLRMLKAYITQGELEQDVSIDRDGYSQLVAANHVLILLLRAEFCTGTRSYFFPGNPANV
jgi:hypothetical protein